MKRVYLFIISLLCISSVPAQQTSTVTVTVVGNKNLQLSVGGRDYTTTNTQSPSNITTMSINDLEIGQQSFQVTRTDQNTNQTDRIATGFTLRYGYNMLIKVNGNSSLELIETKRTDLLNNQSAMNNTNFSNLLNSVKTQRSASGKRTVITNAFNQGTNYFTTSQVRQLIQLVNAENFRIQLTKLSYHTITDRSNFYQLYDLINSQAGKNEMQDFVNNYEEIIPHEAMTDVGFNNLYQKIKKQWPVSTQVNSITNAFNSNSINYYTAYQAGQLIQLVSAENSRLMLAKLSWHRITDLYNFSNVSNLIISQVGKNDLSDYISGYSGGNTSHIAMSDVSYNNLYQTIQQQGDVNTLMTSLTNAFTNSNNYFTTAQARKLIQLLSAESNRLQIAKISYRSITDPANFSLIYNLLSRQSSKDELTVFVNNYNAASNPGLAMSNANFISLYQTIQQQWPASTQMNSLTAAFNNSANYFSTHQASQLIQLVSTESSRLQIAKLSFRSIVDPLNFSQVYDLFSNQSSRDELTAYVTRYNTGITPNPPMSDANFSTLFQSIKGQFFPNEKMNSLITVFNNNNNYFSSSQVKQLVQLVSLESNKLQLAKLSYRGITDRENFNQLYALFNSQANRDELEAYVKAYKA